MHGSAHITLASMSLYLMSFVLLCGCFMQASSTTVLCPGSSALTVSMATHFVNTRSAQFYGCSIVLPIYLVELENVSVSFTNCRFVLGAGAVMVVGPAHRNLSVSVVDSSVARLWLLHAVPSDGTDAPLNNASYSVEDTAQAPSLLFLSDTITSLSQFTFRVHDVSWSAFCYNASQLPQLAAIDDYVDGAMWRTSSGAKEPWAAYLLRASGAALLTGLSLQFTRVVTESLVGNVPPGIALRYTNDAAPIDAMQILVNQVGGLPLVTNVHLASFSNGLTITNLVVLVNSCVLDFGARAGRNSTATAVVSIRPRGVLPGGNASIVSLSFCQLATAVVVVVTDSYLWACTVATPLHRYYPTPTAPVLPSRIDFTAVSGTARSAIDAGLPTASYVCLVSVLGASPLSSSSGVNGLSFVVESTSVVFALAVDEAAATWMVKQQTLPLFGSVGVDIVASCLFVGRFSSGAADRITLFVRSSSSVFFESLTVDEVELLSHRVLNISALSTWKFAVFSNVSNVGGAQINAATAATSAVGFHASVWRVVALGALLLRHPFVSLSDTRVGCSVGCQHVNLTVVDLRNLEVGRLLATGATANSQRMVNVTVTVTGCTFESHLAAGSVSVSSYSNSAVGLSFFHALLTMVPGCEVIGDKAVFSFFTTRLSWMENTTLASPVDVLAPDAARMLLTPQHARFGRRPVAQPAVIDITAVSVSLIISANTVFRSCGWGQHCVRYDNSGLQSSTTAVSNVAVQIQLAAFVAYGWQSTVLIVVYRSSPQDTNTRVAVHVSSTEMSLLYVTPLSGAAVVAVGGTAATGTPQEVALTIDSSSSLRLVMECFQDAEYIDNVFGNLRGITGPSTWLLAAPQLTSQYTSSALYVFNQTMKGVDGLGWKTTFAVSGSYLSASTDVCPTSVSYRFCSDTDASLAHRTPTTNATVLSPAQYPSWFVWIADNVSSSDEDAADRRVMVLVPQSRLMLLSAILFSRVDFTAKMEVQIMQSTIASGGVAIDVTDNATLSGQSSLITTGTTIQCRCSAFATAAAEETNVWRWRWAIESLWLFRSRHADVVWNSTLWARCAAYSLLVSAVSSSTVVINASVVAVEAAPTLASLTPQPTSGARQKHVGCDVSSLWLQFIVVAGAWSATSEIGVAQSSVMVNGQVQMLGSGLLLATGTHGIVTWQPSIFSASAAAMNATHWTATSVSISISQRSSISVLSQFGPACVFHFANSKLNSFTIRSHVHSTAQDPQSVQRLAAADATQIKAATVVSLPRAAAWNTNESAAGVCANTAIASSMLDDQVRRLTPADATIVHFGKNCVAANLTVNFTDSHISAEAQLEQGQLKLAALSVWALVSESTSEWANVTIPLSAASAALQRRRAVVVHFAGGDMASSAVNIVIHVARAVALTAACEVLPVPFDAPVGVYGSIATPMLTDLRCQATNMLFGRSFDAVGVNVNITLGSLCDAVVRTGGFDTAETPLSPSVLRSEFGSDLRANLSVTAALALNLTWVDTDQQCASNSLLGLYAPATTLRRSVGRLSSGGVCLNITDTFATSEAANVLYELGFNSTGDHSLPQLISQVGGSTKVNNESIALTAGSSIFATTACVTEAASSVNMVFAAGRQSASLLGALSLVSSGACTVAARSFRIPIMRVNLQQGALSTEDAACAARLRALSASCPPLRSVSVSDESSWTLREEPTASNLHLRGIHAASLSLLWADVAIDAIVRPLFFNGVAATLASSAFYALHTPVVRAASTALPANALLMVAAVFPHHARNVRLYGSFRIAQLKAFHVTSRNNELLAQVATGIDGRAENVVFEGEGEIVGTTSVFSLAGIAQTLRAVGSVRGVSRTHSMFGVFERTMHHLQSANIAYRENVTSSYRTVAFDGLTLLCSGYCVNLEFGSAQPTSCIGTRIAANAMTLSAVSPTKLFTGSSTGSSTITTLVAPTGERFQARTIGSIMLGLPESSQLREYGSSNVALRNVGAASSVTVSGSQFYSSGWNVACLQVRASSLIVVVTANTNGFSTGKDALPAAAWPNYADTFYSTALPNAVRNSHLPYLPRACSVEAGVREASAEGRRCAPAVGNVVIMNSSFDATSTIAIASANYQMSSMDLFKAVADVALVPQSSYGANASLVVDVVNVLVADSRIECPLRIVDALDPQRSNAANVVDAQLLAGACVALDGRTSNLWLRDSFFASRVALAMPKLLLKSTAAVQRTPGCQLSAAVLSSNLFVQRCIFNAGRLDLQLANKREVDIQAASGSMLVSEGIALVAAYPSSVTLLGVDQMIAATSGGTLGNATNIVIVDTVFRKGLLAVSSSVAPAASVAGGSARMSASAAPNGAAANIIIDGSTQFTLGMCSLMIQGFSSMTAHRSFSQAPSFFWARKVSPAPDIIETGELTSTGCLPSTNIFFGVSVAVRDGALYVLLSSTNMSSASANMILAMGGNVADRRSAIHLRLYKSSSMLCTRTNAFDTPVTAVDSDADGVQASYSCVNVMLKASTFVDPAEGRLLSLLPFQVADNFSIVLEWKSSMRSVTTSLVNSVADNIQFTSSREELSKWSRGDSETHGWSTRRPPCAIAATFEVSLIDSTMMADSGAGGRAGNVKLDLLEGLRTLIAANKQNITSLQRLLNNSGVPLIESLVYNASHYCGWPSDVGPVLQLSLQSSAMRATVADGVPPTTQPLEESGVAVNVLQRLLSRVFDRSVFDVNCSSSIVTATSPGVAVNLAFQQELLLPLAALENGDLTALLWRPPSAAQSLALVVVRMSARSTLNASGAQHVRNVFVLQGNTSFPTRASDALQGLPAGAERLFQTRVVVNVSVLGSSSIVTSASPSSVVRWLDVYAAEEPSHPFRHISATSNATTSYTIAVRCEEDHLGPASLSTDGVVTTTGSTVNISVDLHDGSVLTNSLAVSELVDISSVGAAGERPIVSGSAQLLLQSLVFVERLWINASSAVRESQKQRTALALLDSAGVARTWVSIAAASASRISVAASLSTQLVENTSVIEVETTRARRCQNSTTYADIVNAAAVRQRVSLVSIVGVVDLSLVNKTGTGPLRSWLTTSTTDVVISASGGSGIAVETTRSSSASLSASGMLSTVDAVVVSPHMETAVVSQIDLWSPSSDLFLTMPSFAELAQRGAQPTTSLLNMSQSNRQLRISVVVQDNSFLRARAVTSSTPSPHIATLTVAVLRAPFAVLPPLTHYFDSRALNRLLSAVLEAGGASCPPHRGLFAAPTVEVSASVHISNRSSLLLGDERRTDIGGNALPPAFIKAVSAVWLVTGSLQLTNATADEMSYRQLMEWSEGTYGGAALLGSHRCPSCLVSPAVGRLASGSSFACRATNFSTIDVTQSSTMSIRRLGASAQGSDSLSTVGIVILRDLASDIGSVLVAVLDHSRVSVRERTDAVDVDPCGDLCLVVKTAAGVVVVSRVAAAADTRVVVTNCSSISGGGPNTHVVMIDNAEYLTNASIDITSASNVTGAWGSLLTVRRLRSSSIMVLRHARVVVLDSVVDSMSTPCIVVPLYFATVRNCSWIFAASTVVQSAFVTKGALVDLLPHPLQAAPPTGSAAWDVYLRFLPPAVLAPTPVSAFVALQLTLDNVTVGGFGSVFSPTRAHASFSGNMASSAITVAGGSTICSGARGDWPARFIGLPDSMALQLVRVLALSPHTGLAIVPLGRLIETPSLSGTASSIRSVTSSESFAVTSSVSHSKSNPSMTATHTPTASAHLSSSESHTFSRSAPTSSHSASLFFPLCPNVAAYTDPLKLRDLDISSDDALKYLYIAIVGSVEPSQSPQSSVPAATAPLAENTPTPASSVQLAAAVVGNVSNETNVTSTAAPPSTNAPVSSTVFVTPSSAAAGHNVSVRLSQSIGDFLFFRVLTRPDVRSERRGFDTYLSSALNNASKAYGAWVAQDAEYQVMRLQIPTSPQFALIGDEDVVIEMKMFAIVGGCRPFEWDGESPPSPDDIVLRPTFRLHTSLSGSLAAASAVVAVVGGSIALGVTAAGSASSFVALYEIQLLALLGSMGCSLPDQIQFAVYIRYILSPFASNGPQWMALGGSIVLLVVVALHGCLLILLYLVLGRSPSLVHAKATVLFPGVPLLVGSVLLAGIVSGAFRSAKGTDSESPSLGSAMAGIGCTIVLMAYLGKSCLRDAPALLDFRPYLPLSGVVLDWHQRHPGILRWCLPCGAWRSSSAPYDLHNSFSMIVGNVKDGHHIAVLVNHLQLVAAGVLCGYHFGEAACYGQYICLLLLHVLSLAYYAWRQPYRFPAHNAAVVIGQLWCVCVLAANVAYSLQPGPAFTYIQTGLQLGLAVTAVLKLVVCGVIAYLDYRLLQAPPVGRREPPQIASLHMPQLPQQANIAPPPALMRKLEEHLPLKAIHISDDSNSDFPDSDDEHLQPKQPATTVAPKVVVDIEDDDDL